MSRTVIYKLFIFAAILVSSTVAITSWITIRDLKRAPELRPLDWWEQAVFYQIYPRSFKDSDGDGIGDLKGITSKLEHLVDAGVGALWISPIFKSPMIDFGYDISNWYDINENYGNMTDFEDLVEKAHNLGLKVILDFVINHASIQSEYFIKSEQRQPGYENFFIWADPKPNPANSSIRLVPSNWISFFSGPMWQWSDIRQQYYLHQFAVEQADFNFREPAVRKEMTNIMLFWLSKGIDGFRVDALPHLMESLPDENGIYPDDPLSGNMFIRPGYLGYTVPLYTKDLIELYDVIYEWRDVVDLWKAEFGGDTKVLLTEGYANISMTMLYYGDEESRIGSHFPFNFDLITELSSTSTARDFVYVVKRWLTYMPKGKVANWQFGNHDRGRMASRFRTNMIDGLNSLYMLLPGVPITYQGEEIGMRNCFVSWDDTVDVKALNEGDIKFSRDPYRTPYHWDNSTNAGFSTNASTWLPVGEDYLEINLQVQKEAERSNYKVYQSLTRLRKQPAISHGDYEVQALTKNTLLLIRYLKTFDTYALVFNVGIYEDTVDLSNITLLKKPLVVAISSVHSTRLPGATVNFNGLVTLNPGEGLVLHAPPF